MCGGSINVAERVSVAQCPYCKETQTFSIIDDEKRASLFNRANDLRLAGEFDKAADIYEKIIDEDNNDSEAHWGMVLCKYGIEYVEDYKTHRRIPTCHRVQYESIARDVDFIAACKNALIDQQYVYIEQAKAIAKIQKGILSIANKEEPFDVFICYKETDEYGRRTPDSALANDIYHQLTQEGYKVFYSAITLENKIGEEYEPYIFAAINSAKVMLVIGTKPEYFNAVWVRNEWSRYLKLLKTDHSRLLIPCYKDMDPYYLPEEFAHLQAQDMSKIGFINDLVRGVKKVIGITDSTETLKRAVNPEDRVNTNTASLLRRAFMFLEDEDWENANAYCEKILDNEPECAQAYLGKLMSDLHVKKLEDLENYPNPFENNRNYQRAIRFGDEKLVAFLNKVTSYIELRNEEAHKDSLYNSGIELMSKNTIEDYESAINSFQSACGWKDSDNQICICKKRIAEKISEIKAKEKAKKLECERLNQKRATRKKIKICFSLALVVVITFIITWNLPAIKYRRASSAMNSNNYKNACALFYECGNYKDAKAKAYDLTLTNPKLISEAANVGETIYLGKYEQDNNVSNGKEVIEWCILARENNKILVISKYGIDCKPYDINNTNATWETSTLRNWLNNDFWNKAFTDSEKSIILCSNIDSVQDNVFLISARDAENYFGSEKSRRCVPTDYAIEQGAYARSDYHSAAWWLRSPNTAVSDYGRVSYNIELNYYIIEKAVCVRPALWINLDS